MLPQHRGLFPHRMSTAVFHLSASSDWVMTMADPLLGKIMFHVRIPRFILAVVEQRIWKSFD